MKHLNLYHLNDLIPLNYKKVLLRADLNVPLNKNTIANDYRLRALQPTLDYLLSKNATVFIATHLGRPKNGNEENLSTQLLVPWFKKQNYNVYFEPSLEKATQNSYAPRSVIILENMRFFPGEKSNSDQWARQLAALADVYVNDAFATLHRDDVSTALVADYFLPGHKSIGLLIEKELNELNKLLDNPAHPFLLIIGGGKVETKLQLIEKMLDSVNEILLCPALVFTFLKAQGKEVGKSLVEDDFLETSKLIVEKARQRNITIHFPLDYQVAKNTLNGPLRIIEADQFDNNDIGISIGPKTITSWCSIIKNVKTVFFNAAMGFAQRAETLEGLHNLLNCIATSNAHIVAGGGDSVSAIEQCGLQQKFDFLSTGGGATLSYMSGQSLPGLVHLQKK